MPSRIGRALALTVLLSAVNPAARGTPQSLCLYARAGHEVSAYPVVAGDDLRLNFRHSIYGSEVEERFRVAPQGFQSTQIRYGELRLVEFYGHESARREDGWWVVDTSRRDLGFLALRASPDAFMRITFHDHQILLGREWTSTGQSVAPFFAPVGRYPEQEPPAKAGARVKGSFTDGYVRLSVSACQQKSHG